MNETVRPERTAVEIWQELNACMQLSAIIADDLSSNPDLLRFNMYQMQINALSKEAADRFNLVTDPRIGDPIPQLPIGQKYFSQWYAETAEQELLAE
jgi:hypothetical protein